MTSPAARHHSPAARRRALLLVLLAGLALVPLAAAGGAAPPTAEVVMPDTDLTVSELVAVVRDAATDVPGSEPDRDLRIVFTDELPGGDPYVGGLHRGSTVWIRVGIAMPTRTLLHEVAHALTPGAGHGDTFRAVYLAAVADVHGEATAAREARRLAWVYDRCYLDRSCPEV